MCAPDGGYYSDMPREIKTGIPKRQDDQELMDGSEYVDMRRVLKK